MIRVELLGRRRSPWSRAFLAALVVCGGLYGIYQLFPALAGSLFNADFALSSMAQQEATPSSVEQEIAPKPVERQETDPSPLVQQEEVPHSSVAQQEAIPSTVVPQEIEPKPVVVLQEAIPSSGMQQETTPSLLQEIDQKPAAQQETMPSPVAQQEITSKPVARQETTPSPGVAQQEATPSPVQEIAPDPVVQREAPTTHQPPSPQRSTACHQVMRIDKQVPAGTRVASLNCNSTGEYWLEGTSPSHKVLREFRLRLQALPSRVSFSTWREERTLRFAFQGRLAERDNSPLAALSSGQAEQFLRKVAHWADASGLDSLSIHKPIHRSLSPARTHQRQKLRGIGSLQQIGTFLHQFQQYEAVATLGEVLLMPIKSDERGWVQARLYAAVDILVEVP